MVMMQRLEEVMNSTVQCHGSRNGLIGFEFLTFRGKNITLVLEQFLLTAQ